MKRSWDEANLTIVGHNQFVAAHGYGVVGFRNHMRICRDSLLCRHGKDLMISECVAERIYES